ncbi:MAG: HAD family hydrolase [Lachnospiraceae bacterium]|nr:HAD family hydrolase [Lachnospiraceae bacterium]
MKNLIFDIDGTLWNTTGVVAGAWNKAIRKMAVPELARLTVTADMLKKEFGKPMDVIADDLFGDIDAGVKAELLDLCCEYEQAALSECDENLTYEGMNDTLRKLSEDHKLFIVSNCQDGYIELVIRKTGLTGLIKDFECFGRTELQKDENIELVMERNGLEPSDTVYIGDTMGDFTATKKAGIKFVFASYGFGDVAEPDYVISSIGELLKLV